MRQVWYWIKREMVLVLSALAAAVTAFFVPPDHRYLSYVDARVLGILFCLMAVVGGLRQSGFLDDLAQRLTAKAKNFRSLCRLLVFLCFFSSMLLTNDVALLAFVPFTLLILNRAGKQKETIWVLVLETLAANLGSMLTPVGNPQNLYLFAHYHFSLLSFFKLTLPVVALSGALLWGCGAVMEKRPVEVEMRKLPPLDRRKIRWYGLLFLLCILAVLRLLPIWALLGITVLFTWRLDKRIFQKIDYSLLLTFLFFFLFVGNMGRMDGVRYLVQQLLDGRELLAAVGVSQVISNVPAAMLLSAFTSHGESLVMGTNLGGLGTLIASLASLITFKFYQAEGGAAPARYLAVFTAANLLFLGLLAGFVRLVLPGLF